MYDRSLSLAYFIDSYPCNVPVFSCIQFRYCFVAFTSSTARSSPVLYMVASNPPAGLNTLSAAINFASVLVFPCLIKRVMCKCVLDYNVFEQRYSTKVSMFCVFLAVYLCLKEKRHFLVWAKARAHIYCRNYASMGVFICIYIYIYIFF